MLLERMLRCAKDAAVTFASWHARTYTTCSVGTVGLTGTYGASTVAYKLQTDCMTRHSKPRMAVTCAPGVHLQAAAVAM